jgi:succinoglycan biosynthesis transport protein ExoP
VTEREALTRRFDALASRIDIAGLRSVGFTSALLGEGVSTIALGTALALAALRRPSVLLVDANWLEPSLTADARLDRAPGLADHLAGRADLAAVVRPASRGVSFLPVGDRSAARPTLRELSTFLVTEVVGFNTVVVDLPPVLPGEALVLPWASLLDRLFVVLREAATPLGVARQALDRLTLAAAPDIVLNRREAPTAGILTKFLPARA